MLKKKEIGYLYIIKNELNLIKVGISINPKKRIASIESSSGLKITEKFVSNKMYNFMEIERKIHKEFSDYRTVGEWFNIEKNTIIDFFNSIEKEKGDIVLYEFSKFNIISFEDYEIRQNKQNGYFCLTDMLKVINKNRILNGLSATNLGNYFNAKPTKEFLKELSKEKGIKEEDLVFGKRKVGTWVHKYILIDFSLWGCQELKVRIHHWICNNLLQKKEKHIISFDEVNLVLDKVFNVGGKYWIYTNVAIRIADEVGLSNVENCWQYANEIQLKQRDILQREIMYSALHEKYPDVDYCVDKAIEMFRDYNVKPIT